MIRQTIFAFLIFLSIPSYSQDKQLDNPDRPPVIAITAIANFTRYLQESHDIMAIRDKVVSDLVRNYECVVISRSNGFAIATENALGKMNAVNSDSPQAVENIPAADFAITGYFKITKQEQGKATLGCTLLITDLQEKSKADFQKAEFVPSEDTNFSPDITAKIVEMLKLKPKKKLEPVDEQLNETWAILPVSHLESLKQMDESADKSLSMSMELALQESNKVRKIVDHAEIDKVLEEFKISSLSGANESLAANIAGIVGADRVLMGTVSRPSRRNNNLRLDLLLVDGKKAVVLDSASAVCKKEEMEETASALVLQLTGKKHNTPDLRNTSQEIRKKECKLYLSMFDSISGGGSECVDLGISWAEAAYMLVPDDSTVTFEIAKKLFDRILCGYTSYISFENVDVLRVEASSRLTKQQIKKITTEIDKILQPESRFTKSQYPLIIRADSYRLLGDYDHALNLINQHLSKYPDTERAYAYAVLGTIYYLKEDYQKAEASLDECQSIPLGKKLAVNTYKKLGNEKKELEYIKKQGGDWDVARCLQLIRKLEGPKAVIEYSRRRPLYQSDKDSPGVQLEFARTYIELGDTKKAAVILENINNEGVFKASRLSTKDPAYVEKVKSDVKDLIKQTGPVKTEWKKSSEIAKIPDKYKLYIQPIGMTDVSIIQDAIPGIEEFWGIRVKILPVLPLPEDPSSFNKARGQYEAGLLVERVLRTVKQPEDSIFTLYTTEKDIYYDYNKLGKKPITKSINARSLSILKNEGNAYLISNIFSKGFGHSFAGRWKTNKNKTSEDYDNRPYFGDCDYFSCFISSVGASLEWSVKYKNYALCEDCQKKMKKVNFDELYGFWQNTIKLEELTDPQENKWVEEYKVKVQEALKNAEEEKARKAKEKIDYLPAVEITDAKPGLSCDYYEFDKGKVKNIKQLMELQPQKSIPTPSLSIDTIERKENFGLVFSGFIKVPADDVYTFYLSSDDGSSLSVNDTRLIDNNATNEIVTKTGTIALKAGLHPISLAYYQAGGAKFLELYWRSEIHLLGKKTPNEVLFHK